MKTNGSKPSAFFLSFPVAVPFKDVPFGKRPLRSLWGALASLVLISLTAFSFSPSARAAETTQMAEDDLSHLSTSKLLQTAVSNVREMEAQLDDSFHRLETSMSEKDMDAANIQNHAITIMKGLLRLSEQNLTSLREKAAENDRARVENEYIKILVANKKMKTYYAQVKSAATLDAGLLEKSDVERTLTVDHDVPSEDPFPSDFAIPDLFDVILGDILDPVQQPSYFY